MGPRRLLVYTIAFDSEESNRHVTMAKMLVSSLLRTYFSGSILVIKNTEAPLFLVPRAGVDEVYVETSNIDRKKLHLAAWTWKYRAGEIIDHQDFDRILFVDCDCLALRNIDHLFDGETDITYQPEPLPVTHPEFNAYLTNAEMKTLTRRGINSGTWAVSAHCYHEIMEAWQTIHESSPARPQRWLEQAAWNRVVLDTGFTSKPFEPDCVRFPLNHDLDFRAYHGASIIHAQGGRRTEKSRLLLAMYFQNFYYDEGSTMFHILET